MPAALTVSANSIVLGYGSNDEAQTAVSLDRLVLGFDTVTLAATSSIAGNSTGSLTVYRAATQDSTGALSAGSGGNLTLITPMLTGAAGSVLTVTSGGDLAIAAPGSAQAATAAAGQGATLTLNAANISNATAIVLPSGELAMNAQGSITLGDGSIAEFRRGANDAVRREHLWLGR